MLGLTKQHIVKTPVLSRGFTFNVARICVRSKEVLLERDRHWARTKWLTDGLSGYKVVFLEIRPWGMEFKDYERFDQN